MLTQITVINSVIWCVVAGHFFFLDFDCLHFFAFRTRNRPFFGCCVDLYFSESTLASFFFLSLLGKSLFLSSNASFFCYSAIGFLCYFNGFFMRQSVVIDSNLCEGRRRRKKRVLTMDPFWPYWIPDKIYTIFQSSMLIENCQ